MRKKYYRVLINRLRSVGPRAIMRQGWNTLAVARSAKRGGTPRAPVSATLALTYRCNQRCIMCNFPERVRKDSKEMSTDRAKEIVCELARMGTSGISFYGGEPLLRKDIVELVTHARHQKLMTHVPTNGMLLTSDMAASLMQAGVDLITISLDGATAAPHDRQRGVTGAFASLQRAISNLLAARSLLRRPCHLALAMTLTERNASELEDTIRLARSLGVDTISIFEAQSLSGLDNLPPSSVKAALLRIYGILREEKKKHPDFIDNSMDYINHCIDLHSGAAPRPRCFAPYSDIFIDTYENVYVCNYFFGMAKPAGNLGGGSVAAFWKSGDYMGERKRLADCALCNYMCHRELSFSLDRLAL